MKAFAFMRMAGGLPDVDFEATPVHGYAHVPANLPGTWGAYLVSGTGAQLNALQALGSVVGIVAVTESGGVIWGELDGVVSTSVMTKLNNWIDNNHPTWPRVQEHHTYRQIIKELFKKLNRNFKLSGLDVDDIN